MEQNNRLLPFYSIASLASKRWHQIPYIPTYSAYGTPRQSFAQKMEREGDNPFYIQVGPPAE
jgi:hypothetical protein